MRNEKYYNVYVARDITGMFIRGALDILDLHNFYTLKKYIQNLVEKPSSKRPGSYTDFDWVSLKAPNFFDKEGESWFLKRESVALGFGHFSLLRQFKLLTFGIT
jgi:hypothetical protein